MLVQQQDPMKTSSQPHLQLDAEPLQQGEPRPGPQVPQAAQIAGHCRALGHTVLGTGSLLLLLHLQGLLLLLLPLTWLHWGRELKSLGSTAVERRLGTGQYNIRKALHSVFKPN